MYIGKDKRGYDRIKILLPALFYTSKPFREVCGDIIDISEEGFKASIPKSLLKDIDINKGDDIKIQFIDTYDLAGKKQTSIIQNPAIIKHIEIKDDHIEIGCFCRSEEYKDYIRIKRVAKTIENSKIKFKNESA